MKKLLMAVLAALGLVSADACTGNGGKDITVVAPKEFKERVAADSSALLLDVRRPDEYAEGHLKGARLINWLDRSGFVKEAETLPKDRTLYVYCRSGKRSNEAAHYLLKLGFKVVDMRGGYLGWTAEGLETTTDDTQTNEK